MPTPQDAKSPGCDIAMCVSILSAFGVSAQFGPLQIYSLDPPVHAIKGNVEINTKTSATVHILLPIITTYHHVPD